MPALRQALPSARVCVPPEPTFWLRPESRVLRGLGRSLFASKSVRQVKPAQLQAQQKPQADLELLFVFLHTGIGVDDLIDFHNQLPVGPVAVAKGLMEALRFGEQILMVQVAFPVVLFKAKQNLHP